MDEDAWPFEAGPFIQCTIEHIISDDKNRSMYDELMSITKEYITKISGLPNIMNVDITITCSEDYLQPGRDIKLTDGILYQQRRINESEVGNHITLMVLMDYPIE